MLLLVEWYNFGNDMVDEEDDGGWTMLGEGGGKL